MAQEKKNGTLKDLLQKNCHTKIVRSILVSRKYDDSSHLWVQLWDEHAQFTPELAQLINQMLFNLNAQFGKTELVKLDLKKDFLGA